MADNRPKPKQFKTPKGTFKYPRLGEADTKFKENGEFSVKLVLSAENAGVLEAKLKPLHDAAVVFGKAEYAKLPVATRKKTEFKVQPLSTPVYDDAENETGEVEFNFKMTASGVSKKTGKAWARKPNIFDAKGQPMDGKKVWGGSVGIVAFEVGEPYYTTAAGAGISLRLNAVQVIELVSGGQRAASDYGFDEEDGYTDEGSVLPEETGTEGDGSADF